MRMEAQKEWYFVDGERQQVGPMMRDALQGEIASGTVTGHTLVWSEGMTDWLAASSVDGLFGGPTPQVAQTPIQVQPQVHQPQNNRVASLEAETQVNPYSTPQANLEMDAEVQAKTGFLAMLFSFDGRIPRRTYWAYYFILMGIVFGVMLLPILFLGEESPLTLIVMGVVYIAMIWSSLALQCKRWHDRDKSGWWFLIGLVPLIGGIWSFIEVGCLRGTMGLNDYGEDPT